MSDQITDIKNMWKNAKATTNDTEFVSTSRIIELAKTRKKGVIKMHYANIFILVLTLIGISAFFIYVAKFNDLLSHIGVGLMTGGLILRIGIEFYSIFLSNKIDFSENALTNNKVSLNFHQYRKKIHGLVTLVIIIFYTIGFYMLTPEFSDYFNLPMMVLIDASYFVAAAIFTWSIKTAIKKEMNYLDEILRFQKQIIAD